MLRARICRCLAVPFPSQSKIAAKLGGECRIMVTGSAPIADNVMEFLRICFSASVVEGYGQTEGSAASTLTMPGDDKSLGNVGTPLACNLIKLVDVPGQWRSSHECLYSCLCAGVSPLYSKVAVKCP
jgi:long-subunit acyl-CoA synthetase (AMP-forming)